MAWAPQRFKPADLPAQAWKNGGGLTRELLCLPLAASASARAAGAADTTEADWRVSFAQIAASGPFSQFAGIDRVITLLDGHGAHLRAPGGGLDRPTDRPVDQPIDHRLDQPLQPFCFAGEAPVQAELLGTSCQVLNVMTRRTACRAQLHVLRATARLPRCAQGLLLAVHGAWQLEPLDQPHGQPHAELHSRPQGQTPAPPHNALTLQAGEGLWWQQRPTAWQLRPTGPAAALLAVLIEPRCASHFAPALLSEPTPP